MLVSCKLKTTSSPTCTSALSTVCESLISASTAAPLITTRATLFDAVGSLTIALATAVSVSGVAATVGVTTSVRFTDSLTASPGRLSTFDTLS